MEELWPWGRFRIEEIVRGGERYAYVSPDNAVQESYEELRRRGMAHDQALAQVQGGL